MSWIGSVLNLTCPRCRKGDMFLKPLKLLKPLRMHTRCSVCGQKMEPETGFYYGAMFISYVFVGFIGLSLVGLLVFKWALSPEIAIAVLLVLLSLIFIWNLRFARSLWIHLVIKYNPSAAKNVNQE